MELYTLFSRKSAADPFFVRIKWIIPSSVPKLIVAHPLFRYQDPNLAVWNAGSKGIVGLNMAVWKCANLKVIYREKGEGQYGRVQGDKISLGLLGRGWWMGRRRVTQVLLASLLLLVYLLLLAILLILSLCSFQKSNILDYRTTTIGQVIFLLSDFGLSDH